MENLIKEFMTVGRNIQSFRMSADNHLTKEQLEEAIGTIKAICAFANCAGSEYQIFSRDLYSQQLVFEYILSKMNDDNEDLYMNLLEM